MNSPWYPLKGRKRSFKSRDTGHLTDLDEVSVGDWLPEDYSIIVYSPEDGHENIFHSEILRNGESYKKNHSSAKIFLLIFLAQ